MSFLEKLHAQIQSSIGPNFTLPDIPFDGSNVRFDIEKKNDKAGWVYVNPWDYKGNEQFTATFGSWRAGVKFKVTSYDPRNVDKSFLKAEKKKVKETQEKIKELEKEKYKQCRDKWGPFYDKLPIQSNLHSYCNYKKIGSNYHGRVDFNGVPYIPSYNQFSFVGCQRIFPNPEYNNGIGKDNRKFIKRYTFGIEKIGSYCPFGNIKNAEYVFVTEGFATAASIFEAVGNESSAVAMVWDTSNIYTGILTVRKINPNCKIIICADRDIHKEKHLHNIGEKKAKQAAYKLSNCIVRTVKFDDGNESWSDFNDLHCFESLDAVKSQLEIDVSDFVEIVTLGYNGKKAYYFATHQKRVFELTANEHNKNQFLLMSGSVKYWGDRYGWLKDAEGEKTSPNWTRVVEKLGQEQTKSGFFNPENIRGRGCWFESGEIAVNLGDQIYYKNEYKPIFNHDIKTSFFYEAGESINVDFNKQLNYEQATKISDAFKLLMYKNPNDYIFLLGWIAVAQIAGAIHWRPHIYLTGPAGAGKSTILDWIYSMIPISISVTDSTAAGIKQDLLNNAKAVIYDESEPNTEKDRNQMADVISLARHCSTMTTGKILRGTAAGKGISYNTNAIFCLGSIQKMSFSSADDSRFFIIEMNSLKSQPHDEFIKLENAMSEIKKFAPMLFSRMVNQYKTTLRNIELCKIHLKKLHYEARLADQLAPILAGYFSFFSNETIEMDTIDQLIEMINFKGSDYVETNSESDAEKCLDIIMQLSPDNGSMSVSQIIELMRLNPNPANFDLNNRALAFNGIKFQYQTNELFFMINNVHLRDKLRKVSNYSDYISLLKRHPKYTGYKNNWINGETKKGVFVKLG